jgi:hypothetical protein
MIKTKNLSILILSLLLLSCGFKKIDRSNINLVNIQNIKVIGDQRTSYSLKNEILLISNKNSNNKYDAEITITNQKKIKIKNKAGKATRYDLSITANLKLINLSNKEELVKEFTRSGDYNVAKNHSDTTSNEKSAEENIIQNLSDDIVYFITFLVRN